MKRKHWFIVVFLLVAGLVGYEMFYSLTPATHADHDHGLANLDAGGFLRVERATGGKRNLVGRPGKVLILHWFAPGSSAARSELPELLDFVASTSADDEIDVALVATGSDWSSVREFAGEMGIPEGVLYLDPERRTADLFGVRRIPETLVYDPNGRLAWQARGSAPWRSPQLLADIQRYKHGVDEVH